MTDQPTDPTTRIPVPGSTPPAVSPPPPGPPPPVPPPSAAPSQAPLPPPAWSAPGRRRDDGRTGSIVFGLIVLGLGLWFFAAESLQLEMPDIEWRQAWPVVLIIIGAWIVLGTLRRRS
jgi:hypothetical protein